MFQKQKLIYFPILIQMFQILVEFKQISLLILLLMLLSSEV